MQCTYMYDICMNGPNIFFFTEGSVAKLLDRKAEVDGPQPTINPTTADVNASLPYCASPLLGALDQLDPRTQLSVLIAVILGFLTWTFASTMVRLTDPVHQLNNFKLLCGQVGRCWGYRVRVASAQRAQASLDKIYLKGEFRFRAQIRLTILL